MAVAIREQVLSAIMAALGTMTIPNVPGTVTVFRGRRKEVPDDDLPAVLLDASLAGSDQANAAMTRNLDRVVITGKVLAATDEALDQALVDFGAAIQRTMEADPTFEGVAVDSNLTDVDQSRPIEEGFGGLGEVTMTYLVEYWTRPGDPYTAAP